MRSDAPHWRIPFSDVRLPPEAVASVTHTLESGWLSMGPRVEEFEDAFARFTDCRHGVACSSGTAALQLALAALGVGRGDEVVMPSLTFVAAANAARLAGARPVFVDVPGDHDLTLAPAAAEGAIGPRTRAIVAMHYGGYPCSPDLVRLAWERGIPLIEDAAHAPGARSTPGPCGAWGAAGCFSFFANKNLPLGEGGMLVTDDDAVAAMARRLRSHGMTSGTWERRKQGAGRYDVERPGFNLRLDEPRAALGLALLPRLRDSNERRAAAVARYRQQVPAILGEPMPFSDRGADELPAHHLAVALIPSGMSRDAVADALARRGIQTSVHYRPVHTLSGYRNGAPRLPHTEFAAERVLSLPLFPHISNEQVDEVCAALADVTRGG